jgi:hypothetical protein
MTALNITTDIPSNINTLEKLCVWAHNCLAELNSADNAVEGDNYSVRSSQAGTFYIASTDTYRHVGRHSISLQVAHLSGAAKEWSFANEISTKTLTAAMKSN